jgi:hypothetical protein
MATEKRAPVFKKVADLRPGTHGHNLHVKVLTRLASSSPDPLQGWPGQDNQPTPALTEPCPLSSAPAQVVKAQVVVDRPRGPKGQPLKVAECIVGDETAVIVFTARNEQGEQLGSAATNETRALSIGQAVVDRPLQGVEQQGRGGSPLPSLPLSRSSPLLAPACVSPLL